LSLFVSGQANPPRVFFWGGVAWGGKRGRRAGEGNSGHLLAELSCSKNEQELEELLLEASQDAGQESL